MEPELSRRAAAPGLHAEGNRAMFDRIAPTYDRLNRLMSLGIDGRWRARTVAMLDLAPGDAVLDLCAGTLDFAALLEKTFPDVRVVACDASEKMLDLGAPKVARTERVVGDALALPFEDGTFAAIVCGFGVRNLADLRRGVREARRVLRPGGAFLTLELFRPRHRVPRLIHGAGLRWGLPLLGAAIANDREAYAYLAESMDGFVARESYEAILREEAFYVDEAADLTLGMVSVVKGTRRG